MQAEVRLICDMIAAISGYYTSPFPPVLGEAAVAGRVLVNHPAYRPLVLFKPGFINFIGSTVRNTLYL